MRLMSCSQKAHRIDSVWTLMVVLLLWGASVSVASAPGALPDGRGYELVTPVEKNGVNPYAAIPSTNGSLVDFQAPDAFAGATTGALNLYQAARTASGWQTTAITPVPVTPLRALEEQGFVWFSPDLSKAIFTTPEPYAAGDEDEGSLSLYMRDPTGALSLLSQGVQGGSEPKQATFDAATPDANNIVFSSAASLTHEATGLSAEVTPEAEFLYQRNAPTGQTSLLNLDNTGHPAGAITTTLSEEYQPEMGGQISVASLKGFAPGQTIVIGTGASAETRRIWRIISPTAATAPVIQMAEGFSQSLPVGTSVVHASEGAVLGDGEHLAAGPPPVEEYLPGDAGSGSTTNAISSDGSKVFFESPNPVAGVPVSLYLRENNSNTVKIAGGEQYGTVVQGAFAADIGVFGSARFEGATADGSLMFFTSEEGLAGATSTGREVYEFNTTSHKIGGAPPSTVQAVSNGLEGDKKPATMLTALATKSVTISVASTAGFHAGEAIEFGHSETAGHVSSAETNVVVSVDDPTELTLATPIRGGGGIASGTEVHGVHPASVVAVSNDGSRVFFVSDGVLAENENADGARAVPVEPNLYVFDTADGETTFIGTLAAGDVKDAGGNPVGLAGEPDVSRPAVPSPDGGVLVFASAADLTGQNPWQQYKEIYRYSVAGNSLLCLSCTAPGVKPTGDASFGETAGGTYDPPGLTSPMSEDGSRVFFETPDSLVPEDGNGNAPLSPKFGTPTSTDVYEWEGGKVSLISSGSASTPALLMGTTPSGDDVLFTTTAQLVPSEDDGGYENVFDARVGGGFPAPAAAAPSCMGSGCRAVFGVASVSGAPAAGSGGSGQGPGSHPATAVARKAMPRRAVCGKARVRRRVRGRVVCAKRARKAEAALGAHAGRFGAVNVHRSR